MEFYKYTKEDFIEEIYNEVIQEYSHLRYEYSNDELQDKIMEIVEERLEKLQK